MALELKQSFRLSQQLVVTPQLQQAIKLLQLSRIELTDLVQKELLENPVLEEENDGAQKEAKDNEQSQGEAHQQAKDEAKGHEHIDEVGSKDGELKEPTNFDWENYIGSYNSPGYTYEGRSGDGQEFPSYENTLTEGESLQNHLLWQLGMTTSTDEEHDIGEEIIGNINDDGYLINSIEDIATKLSVPVDHVDIILKKVQDFDPIGVGARDLQECLLAQCRHFENDVKQLIVTIIKDHLNDLERHRHKAIAKDLGTSLEKVESIIEIIGSLEPKPGRPYSQSQAQYITPDVYIFKVKNDYVVSLNEDGLPKLSISPLYRKAMMQGSKIAGQEKEYIQEKLRAALWLIKSIHQRQRTLYKVTKSILKFQEDFFEKGISYLKPMVLKDVAEDVEMHESTISRVTTSKYMHSPRGLFELKYFFNSSIQTGTNGDGIASEAVRNHIQKLVGAEDQKSPLSDQAIANLLKQNHEIHIARRTVAKYRESLKILPSSRRRRD